jgi:hypothetical protein
MKAGPDCEGGGYRTPSPHPYPHLSPTHPILSLSMYLTFITWHGDGQVGPAGGRLCFNLQEICCRTTTTQTFIHPRIIGDQWTVAWAPSPCAIICPHFCSFGVAFLAAFCSCSLCYKRNRSNLVTQNERGKWTLACLFMQGQAIFPPQILFKWGT